MILIGHHCSDLRAMVEKIISMDLLRNGGLQMIKLGLEKLLE